MELIRENPTALCLSENNPSSASDFQDTGCGLDPPSCTRPIFGDTGPGTPTCLQVGLGSWVTVVQRGPGQGHGGKAGNCWEELSPRLTQCFLVKRLLISESRAWSPRLACGSPSQERAEEVNQPELPIRTKDLTLGSSSRPSWISWADCLCLLSPQATTGLSRTWCSDRLVMSGKEREEAVCD